MLSQGIDKIAFIAKMQGIWSIHNKGYFWWFRIKLRGIIDSHNFAMIAWYEIKTMMLNLDYF